MNFIGLVMLVRKVVKVIDRSSLLISLCCFGWVLWYIVR